MFSTVGACPPPTAHRLPRRTNDDPVARAFGSAIRAAREQRDLTLETVAGRIPRTNRRGEPTTMDPKYLQAVERGFHSPTITTALKIAASIEVPLADLVRGLGLDDGRGAAK